MQTPTGCGSSEEFDSELRLRLGRGAQMPNVSLEIVPDGSVYVLRVNVGGEVRELRDVDCRELFRAAVVVTVAITLSHDAPRPHRAAPSPETPKPAAPESTRDSNLELRAALGAGLNAGLLPGAALELELLGQALWFQRFGVSLAARYLARRTMQDDAGRGLVVDAAGGQALGHYRLSPRWEGGLGGSAYRLAGDGIGPGHRSDHAWAAGPSVEACFLPVQTRLFWLGIVGDARWHVLRPTFEFRNYGPIFTASRFDFSIFLRVGPRFH